MKYLFKGDLGTEVNVTGDKHAATICLRTPRSMSETAWWSVVAELKANALRKRTTPQMTAYGGFCSHIRGGAAYSVAKAVLGIVEKDLRKRAATAA